jgi:predicted nucleotidyltransferase
MHAATEQDIQKMVEAIVADSAPAKVILFGSMARGQQGLHSDVDLLVVAGTGAMNGVQRWDLLKRLNRLLASFAFPKDILVYSEEEFARWQLSPNHVVARAVREGRVLYAKA